MYSWWFIYLLYKKVETHLKDPGPCTDASDICTKHDAQLSQGLLYRLSSNKEGHEVAWLQLILSYEVASTPQNSHDYTVQEQIWASLQKAKK